MKKLNSLLFFITLTITIISCRAPSYFLPAISGNDVSYLPKPMGSDSIKVKNYVSASFAGLALPYSTGDLDLGFVNFSRAHTLKNLNIAYGAFGFAGETSDSFQHNRSTLIPAFGGKGFIGGGLRTSIGYYDNAGNAEFRILSWENALSFESGSYASFRKKMNALQDPYIFSSTKTTFYTTGAASEIIWHTKRNYNNQFAIRLFYGFTPGLDKSLEDADFDSDHNRGAFDFAFFFKLNKLYGIINSGVNRGASGKFSLGYAF